MRVVHWRFYVGEAAVDFGIEVLFCLLFGVVLSLLRGDVRGLDDGVFFHGGGHFRRRPCFVSLMLCTTGGTSRG